MNGFIIDIEDRTEGNREFRRVLYTGPHMQLVVMSLLPGEEIGEEVHEHTDQFFRIEDGRGEIRIDGRATPIESDMAMLVRAGTRHNVKNTGQKPLKFYTLYSPPEHADGTVHRSRADADAAAEQFTGTTTQ